MISDDDQKNNPSVQPSHSVQIKPAEDRSALRRFIQVPWSIYSDDPHWVPPLLIERRQFLSPSNSYFAHARYKFWIAYRGAAPVGRISAQIDLLHLERYGDDTGFFGMLEARDDPEIFSALMTQAESETIPFSETSRPISASISSNSITSGSHQEQVFSSNRANRRAEMVNSLFIG